jgi:hypothetical protein
MLVHTSLLSDLSGSQYYGIHYKVRLSFNTLLGGKSVPTLIPTLLQQIHESRKY